MNLKKEFRIKAKANLQNLSTTKHKFLDKKKQENLLQIVLDSGARNVLVYLPMKMEVDIFPLIFWLKKQKYIRIYSPKICGETFRIVPFRLPLVRGELNIYEAKNSNFMSFNKIDLAIVPILGIDKTMRRVGFGKGMYDRFYDSLHKKPKSIFVSRILNFSNKIITQKHDIQGDIVVAGNIKLYCRKYGGDYGVSGSFFNKRHFLGRLNILHNKKSLLLKAGHSRRASQNQSRCHRKRS